MHPKNSIRYEKTMGISYPGSCFDSLSDLRAEAADRLHLVVDEDLLAVVVAGVVQRVHNQVPQARGHRVVLQAGGPEAVEQLVAAVALRADVGRGRLHVCSVPTVMKSRWKTS